MNSEIGSSVVSYCHLQLTPASVELCCKAGTAVASLLRTCITEGTKGRVNCNAAAQREDG